MNSDTKLGYIVIAALILFIASVCIYVGITTSFPADQRIIAFPDLSNLRIDDQVTVDGVAIGSIKKVTLDKEQAEGRALATITTSKKLYIHEGYKISTLDKGVMGERIITINCGNPQKPLISPKDTLLGDFEPGIAEAMGFVWKLIDEVKKIRIAVESLDQGSPSKKSFVAGFNNFMNSSDSLAKNLTYWMIKAQKEVPTFIYATQKTMAKTDTLLTKTDSFATQTIPKFIETIDTSSKLLATIEKELNALSPLLDSLKKNGTSSDTLAVTVLKATNSLIDIIHFIRYSFTFPAYFPHGTPSSHNKFTPHSAKNSPID